MDIIRRQAELAALGKPYGIRELPAPQVKAVTPAKAAAPAAAGDSGEVDPAKAERLRKREEALARKRAAKGE
jgi:hypothetical protein